MRTVTSIMRRGRKVLEDFNLLKVLQSEISHEVSNPRFQDVETGQLGGFKVDWDSPDSQDVVLRRKCDTGEEIVISALLWGDPSVAVYPVFPRQALVKVFIKKPGLSSTLQFDCRVSQTGSSSSDFTINSASFLRSLSSARSSSAYNGPLFSTLDIKLELALKQYLESRGISEGLTNFIVYHLHKKEQDQYVVWLRRLESTVARSLGSSHDG
ncbi:PREDICTED: uncharacterized protein LOC104802057 [Tarenaya hassleriana]|uniref:uncharacterized protein LOC104802057 n=1 Tax=Tarenaya hassleriana TaxID=28532 RepID=UPI00053C0BAF|nr:PREDICTED: uncharacterized protein LOC104802057 [Tarenaya hassleriana]